MSVESFYFKCDAASLAVLDMITYLDGYMITRINVPEKYRGYGHGSKLLKRACAQADEEKVSLYLTPIPSGPITMTGLLVWYRKVGFLHSGQDFTLIRLPQEAK